MKKILAVEDNKAERALLEATLERDNEYQILTAATGQSALDQAVRSPPDAVILDLMLPGINGLEVLKELKRSQPSLPVIMLTGSDNVQMAVEALQMGAQDYLTKPFEAGHLLLTLRSALEKNGPLAKRGRSARKTSTFEGSLSRIAGKSPDILEVMRQIRKVANSNLTVLIQGETGTGKEPAARALHEEGSRRDKPFVAIDCGALPENLLESELFGHEKGSFSGAERKKKGQFELAERGTLFLDEIGNLSLALQAKLLRVLQERQVRPVGAATAFPINVRFVAASNSSLLEEARQGRFRHDLYYRLAEFTLYLPSLRCRREDILPLAERFREEACAEFQRQVAGLTPQAADLLLSHPWPGNVRELKNVMRQAVLLTPDKEIHPQQIRALLEVSPSARSFGSSPGPFIPSPGLSLRKIVENAAENVERQAILDVLGHTRGNKVRAAKILDVDYKTLRLKIKKYGLQDYHE